MNPRRLYRSRSDRAVAGIAGGMAEYLEVDPTIVRILWVLAGIFSGGLALLLYIVLAFVIPLNPYPMGGGAPTGGTYGGPTPSSWGPGGSAPGATGPWGGAPAPAWSPDWSSHWDAQRATRVERSGRAGLIIGTVLIVFGLIALADIVVPGWLSRAIVGPALLLTFGAVLLVASLRRDGRGQAAPSSTAPATAASTSDPAAFTAAPPVDPDLAPATSASEVPPAPPAPAAGEWDPDATSTFRPQAE